MMLKNTPEPIRSLLIIFFGLALASSAFLALVAKAQTNQTVVPLNPWTVVGGNITQRTANTPIKITGLTTGLCLTLNGSNVLTTTTCGSGGGSGGIASSTPWTAGFLTYIVDNSTVKGVATTSLTASGALTLSQPISVIGTSASALSITNAAADGSTKGAASFTANDFNASSGNISIDYTNGQSAASGVKGFLTGTDWDTFNGKESVLSFVYPLVRAVNSISLSFGTSTSNIWGGTQTFTNSPVFTSLTGGLVSSNASLDTIYNSATTTASCAGTVSCSTFDILGGTPITITGSGGGGGSGNVATSTGETAGQLAYWTSTNATPALLGKTATSSLSGTANQISISNSPSIIGSTGAVLTLPNHVIFPSSFFASSASTTNATTTNLHITGLASKLLRTDANGRVSETTIGSGLSFDGTTLSASGSGITAIGPAGQTQTGATITIASSTSVFNGLTVGNTVVGSGNTLTWTPSLSGTLEVGGGGTGLTSVSDGRIILGNSATALTSLATSTGGTILQTSFTTGRPIWVATSTLGIALSDTTGTLGETRGGTNQTTYTAGDILYASGADTLAKRAIGSGGQILAVVSGVPNWVGTTTAGTGLTYNAGSPGNFSVNTSQNISTLSNLTTNGVVYTSGGTGALNVDSGALDVVRGGTGLTTFGGTNAVLFTTAADTLASDATNFVFDTISDALGLGTTTPKRTLTVASSTAPQLALTDGSATGAPYNFRTINNKLYIATSSPTTFATTSTAIFELDSSTGSTTVQRLDKTGTATSTFAGGINLTSGCYSINGTCVGGSSGTPATASSTVQVFTADGTWTKPSGVQYVSVEVLGGGGSGDATSGNNGGGGGGGAYCRALIDVSSLSSVSIDIGPGGAAATNAVGNAGSQSSFGTHVVAGGGAGGSGLNGGAGGDCSGTVSIFAVNNNDGQTAFVDTEPTADQSSSGAGGGNVYGSGGMPISTASSGGSGSENGRAGTGYGSGGSGAVNDGGESSGAGADGIIIVSEVYNTGTVSGGATPGGSGTELQYRNGSSFGAVSGSAWLTSGFLGLGSTSPWGLFSVASSTWSSDMVFPVISVATSSNPQGELFNIFTDTSLNAITNVVVDGYYQAYNGVRAVFGRTVNSLFATLFVNGMTLSSHWTRACGGFEFIAAIAADTNQICGFISFDEGATATFTSATPNTDGNNGATLNIASATVADNATLQMGQEIGTAIGTTTPWMDVSIGALTTTSSTTGAFIGWMNSATAPTFGCYIGATSTPNYQAVCQTSGALITQVDTGIATSTTNKRVVMHMGNTGFYVYKKDGPFALFGAPVATITTNLPTSATTMQTRVSLRRLVGGTAISPSLVIHNIRLDRAIPAWWKD